MHPELQIKPVLRTVFEKLQLKIICAAIVLREVLRLRDNQSPDWRICTSNNSYVYQHN